MDSETVTEEWDWQADPTNAELYESNFVPTLFAPWARKVADAAGIGAGDRVLDVGCGTGVLAREAAARAGSIGRVTGLDINEGMLAVAQRIAPEIEWRKGDATELPFDDGSFDVVCSQFALMYIEDRVAAVREMRRVLAPGGRLSVAVWGPFEHATAYVLLAGIAERHIGESALDILSAPHQLGDGEKLVVIFEEAGFEQAAVSLDKRQYTQKSIQFLVESEVKGTPLDDKFTEESYRAFLAEAEKGLKPYLLNSGEVSIPLDAYIVSARKGP